MDILKSVARGAQWLGDILGLSRAIGDQAGVAARIRRLHDWERMTPDQRLRILGRSAEPVRGTLGAAAAPPPASERAAAPMSRSPNAGLALAAIAVGLIALIGA